MSMNRFFVDASGQKFDKNICITGEDVNHIKNVLRLRVGDDILIGDGCGRDYHCTIASFEDGCVVADIKDITDNFSELQTRVTLFQGYPKSDKLELIIQKMVELGVYRIVPVMTARTVVKLDEKKAGRKTERYNLIAKSAAKQSGRGIIPEVTLPVSFTQAVEMAKELDANIIPYEEAKGMSHSRDVIAHMRDKKSLGIFIGPEGGFAESEVEQVLEIGGEAITLGHRILRTETAGLATMSILMFSLDTDD
jgi:16S rRNA (uracil1498-N3)-methyltransferase